MSILKSFLDGEKVYLQWAFSLFICAQRNICGDYLRLYLVYVVLTKYRNNHHNMQLTTLTHVWMISHRAFSLYADDLLLFVPDLMPSFCAALEERFNDEKTVVNFK